MEAAKAGWYGSDWFLSFLTLPRAPVLDRVEAAAGQFRLRLGCFVPCAALGVAGMQACSMTCSRQIRAQVSFPRRLCFSHPVTMHSMPFHIPLWFYVLHKLVQAVSCWTFVHELFLCADSLHSAERYGAGGTFLSRTAATHSS